MASTYPDVAPMTTPALRVFLSEWFCGCGAPDDAACMLRDLLALHPLYANRPAFEALIPDVGMQYLLLYTLDHFDLAEHGGSIGGQWLTETGEAVLGALQRESGTDFAALLKESCIHGWDVYEACPECAEWRKGRPPEPPV